MMTVLDEHQNMGKYSYLTFVEFLDMLCRLNIVGVSMENTQDHKCQFFLGLIFQMMYSQDYLLMSDHKLVPVDEVLR